MAYRRAKVKSGCVSVNELSMCTAKAAALSALVTLEKEESREREKQRKAFICVSPNLLQLYVRVQVRTGEGGGAGERIAGAMAWRSMVAFFPFCGHTHRRTHTQHRQGDSPREYPSEVTQPLTALSHQCPKTGARSVEKCFHQP